MKKRTLPAVVLSAMLVLPAATAFGSVWSKPMSRTRGTAIGAAVGALAGPPGMVVGGAVGNGVQHLRHKQVTTHHRHHKRY